MQLAFWHDRWKNGQIGFHQADTNPYLLKHWENLGLTGGKTVFVPMAGKTKDILWLTAQGCRVIAVEISEQAVRAFFDENQLSFSVKEKNGFQVFEADNIQFYCGDYFTLTAEDLAQVSAVFDRAALIAMPHVMRQSYAELMKKTLPVSSKILLVTMEYPQDQMDGPPFAVLENEMESLFSDAYTINHHETFDVLAANPRFADKGLTQMLEKVYVLVSK